MLAYGTDNVTDAALIHMRHSLWLVVLTLSPSLRSILLISNWLCFNSKTSNSLISYMSLLFFFFFIGWFFCSAFVTYYVFLLLLFCVFILLLRGRLSLCLVHYLTFEWVCLFLFWHYPQLWRIAESTLNFLHLNLKFWIQIWIWMWTYSASCLYAIFNLFLWIVLVLFLYLIIQFSVDGISRISNGPLYGDENLCLCTSFII